MNRPPGRASRRSFHIRVSDQMRGFPGETVNGPPHYLLPFAAPKACCSTAAKLIPRAVGPIQRTSVRPQQFHGKGSG